MIREVIVVDNASADGSPEMVAEEFPEITLVQSKENLGFARANNLGLKQASGSYLALINSDVVVHPGCFERLVSFLETHPEAGLVGPKVLGSDGQLQRTCRRFPTIWNTICRSLALDDVFSRWPLFSGREMRHWDHSATAEVETLNGCVWMARRQAVEEVGGLDEQFFFYAEDVDWCKRLRDVGWKVVFYPAATATHFGGGSSSNAPLRYSIEMLRANLAYWRKHRGIPGLAAFYSLSILHHAIRLVLRGLKTVAGRDSSGETAYKCKRSLVCLRWLLTGKEI
jgi:GT2 family glycosyltransferase